MTCAPNVRIWPAKASVRWVESCYSTLESGMGGRPTVGSVPEHRARLILARPWIFKPLGYLVRGKEVAHHVAHGLVSTQLYASARARPAHPDKAVRQAENQILFPAVEAAPVGENLRFAHWPSAFRLHFLCIR